MADNIKLKPTGFQDTGNPVLDSFINYMNVSGYMWNLNNVEEAYNVIKKLAAQEPGGLKRRGKDGALHDVTSNTQP